MTLFLHEFSAFLNDLRTKWDESWVVGSREKVGKYRRIVFVHYSYKNAHYSICKHTVTAVSCYSARIKPVSLPVCLQNYVFYHGGVDGIHLLLSN